MPRHRIRQQVPENKSPETFNPEEPVMRLRKLVFTSLLGVLVTGCASVEPQRREEPGLYNLTGWSEWASDISGEVGHPLTVSAPTARCAPTGNWTTSGAYIASGTLPPGLEMAKTPPKPLARKETTSIQRPPVTGAT